MADPVPTRLVRVDLFEDRVTLTRTLTTSGAAGRQRLTVGPLSPLVRVEALSVHAQDPDTVIEDVSLRRELWTHEEADDDDVTALRDALTSAQEASRDAADALEAAEVAHTTACAHRDAAAAWSGRALLDGDAPGRWTEALRALAEACGPTRVSHITAMARLDERQAEVTHLTERLEAARAGVAVLRTWITLQVVAPPGDRLSLRYTLPCGAWRPVHHAHLADGRIAWQVAASVWNSTGEDWSGAPLTCSTARPGDEAAPPHLEDDRVRASKRQQAVVVEAREETVHVAREGEAQTTGGAPGVADGGEVRTFSTSGPVSVPSSGEPTLLILDAWESDATEEWIAVPEQSSAVVHTTRQHNAGTRPLLAGPVILHTANGVAGRGRVGLVPAGEPFQLGWGPSDHLRVTRKATHAPSTSRITGRQTHTFAVSLHVSNQAAHPKTVTLLERVPVSELAAVTVTTPNASPALTEAPDADGFCAWRLALAPQSHQQLSLTYTVDASGNVTLPF